MNLSGTVDSAINAAFVYPYCIPSEIFNLPVKDDIQVPEVC